MAIKPKDIYKGRQKTHTVAKVVTAVVVALLVILTAAFFWLRQFAVYDEDGNATLISPFAQSGESSPEPSGE